MTLKDRLIRYILKRSMTTLLELEGVVVRHGYTIDELYATLDAVHADKRIQYNANASGEITYRPTVEKTKAPGSHLTWVHDNYPHPKTFVMPFPDIDMSWLFLRSKAERDEYHAMMKGGWRGKSQRYRARY